VHELRISPGLAPTLDGPVAAPLPLADVAGVCEKDPEPDDPRSVYEAYFDLVWRTLRRLGVAEHQVEDAVQDVFLVVHRRWNEFLHNSSVKTWVLGISLRTGKQYNRNASRMTQTQFEFDDTQPSPDCPEFNVEQRQTLARFTLVLERLSYEHRSILVLVELEELSTAQAAEVLEIPTSTAYKRLRKAHQAFEEIWNRQTARDEWRLK
jgi:RNA polymerase sigma-70 factor, ECF subfamily